jgi:hypothetical protein
LKNPGFLSFSPLFSSVWFSLVPATGYSPQSSQSRQGLMTSNESMSLPSLRLQWLPTTDRLNPGGLPGPAFPFLLPLTLGYLHAAPSLALPKLPFSPAGSFPACLLLHSSTGSPRPPITLSVPLPGFCSLESSHLLVDMFVSSLLPANHQLHWVRKTTGSVVFFMFKPQFLGWVLAQRR